jgi:Erv1 / Alr family
MSCPCNLPPEIYPGAGEWGPILWSLLHGLAEHAGRPVTPLFAEDERISWIALFKLTADIIPCHICKEHFRIYLHEHPIDKLKHMPVHEISAWIKHWFWEVHEWVNMTLGKPPFPEDGLHAMYFSMSLRPRLRGLDIPMNRAIRLSGNQLRSYTQWKNKYIMLLSILGL